MLARISMAVLLLMLGGCVGTEVGPFEGRTAPSFEGSTLSGQTLTIGELRGRPTMMVFWASWCGPCRTEAPDVARVAQSYGDRIHVVGVNAGEDPSVAMAASRQMNMSWPVVLDSSGAIRNAYKVSSIPLVLVIDADGRVRHRNNGIPTDIHRLLDGLLG